MITKGTLKILDPTGHTELVWENMSDATRTEAEKAFDKALEGNFTPFHMLDDGKGNIDSFQIKDGKLPETGDVVLVPQLRGG